MCIDGTRLNFFEELIVVNDTPMLMSDLTELLLRSESEIYNVIRTESHNDIISFDIIYPRQIDLSFRKLISIKNVQFEKQTQVELDTYELCGIHERINRPLSVIGICDVGINIAGLDRYYLIDFFSSLINLQMEYVFSIYDAPIWMGIKLSINSNDFDNVKTLLAKYKFTKE